MNTPEARARLLPLRSQLHAIVDELRTVSKAAQPETTERDHVKTALQATETALAEVTEAINVWGMSSDA